MSTEYNSSPSLKKLSKSNFEMADGDPDIRGWDLKNSEGEDMGEVEELLFDEESRKVRYMIVNLDSSNADSKEKQVLVPIGLAELHQSDDDVLLPGVTMAQLQSLPEYNEDDFDNNQEMAIRSIFAGGTVAAMSGTSDSGTTAFYDHDHFNEENLYRNRKGGNVTEDTVIPVVQEELQVGKREMETGGVRLRSRIVEKEVAKDINLKQEAVRVERTAVDRLATEGDLQEGALEATTYKEVPVVSKEARVVEEISLNKEVTHQDKTITDTVRNTEVDIDETDKTRTKGL